MSAEDNKALVRELYLGLWNDRDFSVVDEYVHPDHQPEGPFSDQFPPGPEGTKAFASTFIIAFPNVVCTVDKQEADGNIVRTWLTYVGTQDGQLMDIPPTGREATVKVLSTDEIEDGMIVASSLEWDPNDMMRQLGVG
jgi:predicted ester cyclase